MELRLMNRIADTSPAFVCTLKTLTERDDERDEPESDTQLIGLGIQFASLTRTIPNVEVRNCQASLIVLNVTMVQPALVGHGTRMQRGQQATLRERLLTASFGRTQRERPISTTITIANKSQIPHPCQLYRRHLSPPLCPPRRLLVPFEQFDEEVDIPNPHIETTFFFDLQNCLSTHNQPHNRQQSSATPSPSTPRGSGKSLSTRRQREMSRPAADWGSEVERWVGEVGREAERAEGMVAQKGEPLALHCC
ncbi:hypothetical protein BLNAU_15342 [Blattamonas nauphoetae]|uniref:Uncharacterized protein n=1 Tax=Blattamonas nauphoetae TaxID=2049346 RepID=A0ABQ9XBB4_9EUKA|nr:hypothetical protein BLNAU_15342 [Blattamonas nauphoetae]